MSAAALSARFAGSGTGGLFASPEGRARAAAASAAVRQQLGGWLKEMMADWDVFRRGGSSGDNDYVNFNDQNTMYILM